MPLIEVTQSRYVSATIRLDSETATLIDQVCGLRPRIGRRCGGQGPELRVREGPRIPGVFEVAAGGENGAVSACPRGGAADVSEPVGSSKRSRGGVDTRRQPLEKASVVPEESRSVLRTG